MESDMARPLIIFTGGGSAGHVVPCLPLMERFQQRNWRAAFVGSGLELEKSLVEPLGIPYYAVKTGKLRRYFSWQNFTDILRVMRGILQAAVLCRELKPAVVFCKGGYVSFPVAVGAWLNGTPIVSHESDHSPGLANRLVFPFVSKACVSFAATRDLLGEARTVYTGSPLRSDLFLGDASRARDFLQAEEGRPILLLLGGSQGAQLLNQALRKALPALLESFQVVHQCGAGNLEAELDRLPGYWQFAFIGKELPDILALADVVVSRAGANALAELLALRIPHLLTPLVAGSRGEQVENADLTSKQGWSMVLSEKDLGAESLTQAACALYAEREQWRERMESFQAVSGTKEIESVLLEVSGVQDT